MEHLRKLGLLDEKGQPVDDRTYAIFDRLVLRFRRHFPSILDEAVFLRIFETAAWRFLRHERSRGPLAKPHGYAWKVLHSVAVSESRGPSIEGHRFQANERTAATFVSMLPAQHGTPEEIDNQVLLNEMREQLKPEEWLVLSAHLGGYSSRQIGRWRGRSPEAVDVMLSRIRKKLRAFVAGNGQNIE
jgi:DNA-directed RNA polymerase specialized sigma24 family protein